MTDVAIIGATGYSGQELARLLNQHPDIRSRSLHGSSSRSEPVALSSVAPDMTMRSTDVIEPLDLDALIARNPDVVFLATPHEASAAFAPALAEAGIIVIDLSGAFRLKDPDLCQHWYGLHHHDTLLAQSAVYGLPELHRDELRSADLISCPGCYPTSVLVPLIGLKQVGLIDLSSPIVVDSASGVSGAGRTPSARTHFCELSYEAYGVTGHRHEPEMIAHGGVDVMFTPHIGPWKRGILSTIHAMLCPDADVAESLDALRSWAESEAAVRLYGAAEGWPSVDAAAHTNCCDFRVHVDENRNHITVISAIDNLIKGAAGQAVQCMNLRLGLPEGRGLVMKASAGTAVPSC